MTKINFQRTGGFMGRKVEAAIDLNQIPEEESQEIQRLILETNFFNIPQNLVEPTGHDEFEYTVTVDAGNSHHTIHTTDSSAPQSLRALLDKLSTLAKAGNSPSPLA